MPKPNAALFPQLRPPMSHDNVPADVREDQYQRERNSPEYKEEKHQQQEEEAKERVAPSGVIVYKTILKEGQDELDRSSSALFWSGLAAGLSMARPTTSRAPFNLSAPES